MTMAGEGGGARPLPYIYIYAFVSKCGDHCRRHKAGSHAVGAWLLGLHPRGRLLGRRWFAARGLERRVWRKKAGTGTPENGRFVFSLFFFSGGGGGGVGWFPLKPPKFSNPRPQIRANRQPWGTNKETKEALPPLLGFIFFHVLSMMFLVCPVGFKGNRPLLETFVVFPGKLKQMDVVILAGPPVVPCLTNFLGRVPY